MHKQSGSIPDNQSAIHYSSDHGMASDDADLNTRRSLTAMKVVTVVAVDVFMATQTIRVLQPASNSYQRNTDELIFSRHVNMLRDKLIVQ